MAQPIYTYEVADLRTGNILGDLPLTGVTFTQRLNDSGTLRGSFVLESRNATKRAVEDPYDWTTPARRTLTVYRDERPVWSGIIWTSVYNSTTRTMQIGAGDYWTYFDHRKILPVLTLVAGTGDSSGQQVAPDLTYVSRLTTLYTGVDQNAIARALVTQAQAHTGGDIGIQLDASLSAELRDREYSGFDLTSVGTALRNLAGVLGGPDIVFDVAPTLDAQGKPVRRMRIGTPNLGQESSAWVWEYDSNLIDYAWPRDGTGFTTREFAVGDGTALDMPIAVSENTSPYAEGWALMETEHQWSGEDVGTLQAHADTEQMLGRRPIVLPTLTVRGDMDPIVGAWSVGDDGVVSIEDDLFLHGVEAPVRIVAAEISPGEETELVTLTVAPLVDEPY